MGNFIGILLYTTGYTYDYKENNNERPLAIGPAPNNTFVPREVSDAKASRVTKIPGLVYNSIIILIMLWRVFYSVYMAFRDGEFLHVGRTTFQVLFAFQYVLGIIYFRADHFYENIGDKSEMISKLKMAVPFTILIALALSITMTGLMATGHTIHGYTDVFDSANLIGQVFLSVLLFVDTFYSYLTFTINACIFTVNMLYQKSVVNGFVKRLNLFINSSQDGDSKVTNIAQDYALTKDGWDATVSAMTYFFWYLNFFGFLASYFYLQAIEQNDISADEISNLVLFILIDVIYIYSITNVNRDISRISDTLGCTALLLQYFTNEKDDEHSLRNIGGRLNRLDVEMGFVQPPHPDPSPAVIATRRDSDEESGLHTESDGQYNFDALNHPANDEVYLTDPNTNAMLRQIHTTVTGTAKMGNWANLQSVAGARWKTFRLFGVELTDTTLISRIVGLILALGIASELVNTLNWF